VSLAQTKDVSSQPNIGGRKSGIPTLLTDVDLGPNLSVTGSLATILWLIALRRENVEITAWEFLEIGMAAMPLALFGSIVLLRRG
jgi:arsenical pump membrane protein